MARKKGKFVKRLKASLPYVLVAGVVFSVAWFGSRNKVLDTETGLNMQIVASNNYSASADQIAEFYMVSELADVMNLATSEAVNVNFNSLTSLVSADQTTTDKFEKPANIVGDCEYQTGVVTYTVAEGETVQSIAARYAACGVTETMVRWSNSMANAVGVAPGQVIYVPARAGFVYKVKSGDTVESVAAKYGSSAAAIISSNSLELDSTILPDWRILVPDGNLPETERPDYVAPRPAQSSYTQSVYYRLYWTSANPMPYGWCTWYAWARRAQMGGGYTLPGGLGNANTWDNSLAGSYPIDSTPRPGDVYQTDAGWYGHVGIVESVNPDGTITISDMNGILGWGRVGTATISSWAGYKFIHSR